VAVETQSTAGNGPFESLLRVQDLDTGIAQLRYRRANLPERLQLAEAHQKLAELEQRSLSLSGGRKQLFERQVELENQAEATGERRRTLEDHLYGSRGGAARDLQAMQEEVAHLQQRQSLLEEQALAVMEEQEPIDAELASMVLVRAELLDAVAMFGAAVAAAEVSMDTEISALEMTRKMEVSGVPPDLVRLYETLRERLGGVGAARLVGKRCSGCHLELAAVEVDRIRHIQPGTVITCEQCGRILVPPAHG